MKQATLDELMSDVHALRRLVKARRENGGSILRFEDDDPGTSFKVGFWQGPQLALGTEGVNRMFDRLCSVLRDREAELFDAVLADAEAHALRIADEQTAEADKARAMLGVTKP